MPDIRDAQRPGKRHVEMGDEMDGPPPIIMLVPPEGKEKPEGLEMPDDPREAFEVILKVFYRMMDSDGNGSLNMGELAEWAQPGPMGMMGPDCMHGDGMDMDGMHNDGMGRGDADHDDMDRRNADHDGEEMEPGMIDELRERIRHEVRAEIHREHLQNMIEQMRDRGQQMREEIQRNEEEIARMQQDMEQMKNEGEHNDMDHDGMGHDDDRDHDKDDN